MLPLAELVVEDELHQQLAVDEAERRCHSPGVTRHDLDLRARTRKVLVAAPEPARELCSVRSSRNRPKQS